MKTFSQKYSVELNDITPSFGIKPTAVLKYFQETFARYCAINHSAGYDVYKLNLKWVLGQTFIEFADVIPIWNEEVSAKIYISSIKKLRIYMNFEVTTKRGIVATGQTIAYLLDINTSRPQPVNPVMNNFNLDNDNFDGEVIKIDFQDSEEKISEHSHLITFADIDYNAHTNNISYVDLGLEGMPVDYIKKNYPKTFAIKYLQETFLNDELKCEIYKNDNFYTHKIINVKDNSTVCLFTSSWQKRLLTQDNFYDVLNEVQKSNNLATLC